MDALLAALGNLITGLGNLIPAIGATNTHLANLTAPNQPAATPSLKKAGKEVKEKMIIASPSSSLTPWLSSLNRLYLGQG